MILFTTRLYTTVLQNQILRYLDSTIKCKDFLVFNNILHSVLRLEFFIEYLKPLTYLGHTLSGKSNHSKSQCCIASTGNEYVTNMVVSQWKEKQVARRTCLQWGVLKAWVSGENIFILISAMVNKENPIKQEEFLLPVLTPWIIAIKTQHSNLE